MEETLKTFLDTVVEWTTHAGIKLIIALVVLFAGLRLARYLTKKIMCIKPIEHIDLSVHSFLKNTIKVILYATVFISAALIVGIPATSFIALLSTAGVAIGLALQGAFSNFAGGIMILSFRPFKVGDYIESNGFSGTVKEISIFYTVLKTVDNVTITIPNGTLMNAVVTNYSVENTRRADFQFSVNLNSDIEKVISILLSEADKHEAALKDPAPFARLTDRTESALVFTLRVWCDSANFWNMKFDLNESINKALAQYKIAAPRQYIDINK